MPPPTRHRPTNIESSLSSIRVESVQELPKFSTYQGQLCQWVELELIPKAFRVTIDAVVTSDDQSVTTKLHLGDAVDQRIATRVYAPTRWPKAADPHARLELISGEHRYSATITLGTHRPWSIYVLSDHCTDDTWDYDSLEHHDRDERLTTAAELNAGPDNAYNFPSAYQVTRFLRDADPSAQEALAQAVRDRRFFVSSTPNQLACGAFSLTNYPCLTGIYTRAMQALGVPPHTEVAYHMESPTWTNGYVGLVADSGVKVFAKSLLKYQAPWIDRLKQSSRLTRLEYAPGRFVYLVLRCDDYFEAMPMLNGLDATNDLVFNQTIPEHLAFGPAYPTAALPWFGTYIDLCPQSHQWAPVKLETITSFNQQGFEYPRLINASWHHFAEHLLNDLGDPNEPLPAPAASLLTIRGDTGSSWEAWPAAAQSLQQGFRALQRDQPTAEALHACSIQPKDTDETQLLSAKADLVHLGDHAWNGASPGSKALNAKIRCERIARATADCQDVINGYAPHPDRASFDIFNPVGFERAAKFVLPVKLGDHWQSIIREADGQRTAAWRVGEEFHAWVPSIPGYATQRWHLSHEPAAPDEAATSLTPEVHAIFEKIKPVLSVDDQPLAFSQRQDETNARVFESDVYTVKVSLEPAGPAAHAVVHAEVEGTAPEEQPSELLLKMPLGFERATWRCETGGGFVTPGPITSGGDSLDGIVGSVIACGTGLAGHDTDSDRYLQIATADTGLCSLGQNLRSLTHAKPDRARLDSIETDGTVFWHLLSDTQNFKEAFRSQLGSTSWRFRFAIKSGAGPTTDADLFRFTSSAFAGLCVVTPGSIQGRPLSIEGSPHILPLRVEGRDGCIHLACYNAADDEQAFNVHGPLLQGSPLLLADMLGNTQPGDPHSIVVPGRSFIRLILGKPSA